MSLTFLVIIRIVLGEMMKKALILTPDRFLNSYRIANLTKDR
ncbi:hypothetical protein [Campylobacter sp.]|nr:hypothetical protein [Campylobacter sp.]MDO4674546.1 hypothetical protein [Campylobacter sp.]